MYIQILGDAAPKVSEIEGLLSHHARTKSGLLGKTRLRSGDTQALVVAADLRDMNNITALKVLLGEINRISKRVFLINQNARLAIAQAIALGATSVLTEPITSAELLRELGPAPSDGGGSAPANLSARTKAAQAGAECIASMFAAVLKGELLDLPRATSVGRQITASIAKYGLAEWLTTVRQHHEGTFQHCLLVTGIAVDFGLTLGLAQGDVERLSSAAMFHDIGKAKIPLAILDKPGCLEPCERHLIETHPVVGYDVLKSQSGVSREILDAVRHHHEYLDGSGYPDGLRAADIPDVVRMLTISDIFAALIEHRAYRPMMPREKAYGILGEMAASGKLEVPLVRAFCDVALAH